MTQPKRARATLIYSMGTNIEETWEYVKVNDAEDDMEERARGRSCKFGMVRVGVRLPKSLIENVEQYQEESELETFSDALRELLQFGLILLRARTHFLVYAEGTKGLFVHKPREPQKAERV